MTYDDRISIQVCLSGYSFRIRTGEETRYSGWMSPDRIFTAPEFQSRYDEVEISLLTPKCTLVPEHFFDKSVARDILGDAVELKDTDLVDFIQEPASGAVLVYSLSIGETMSRLISGTVLRKDGSTSPVLPEFHYMLAAASRLSDYNRIVASYADGRLYLVVSQGRSLMLCNSFDAVDFTTAEYYIFMVMKRLQLNPEQSVIYFRTPLEQHEEMSLYRYFRGVEVI